MIFITLPPASHRNGRHAEILLLAAATDLDAELLQLAVEVGALKPRLLSDTRHVAALHLQVMLEVESLELVARLAQRLLEEGEQRRRLARLAHLGLQHLADILGQDLVFERG